jgi:polyphenol oxidase
LFADPVARVIGAAHAGWKGALAGVLEATVAAMEALGARRDRIRAAIGPTIGRDHYEVGEDFRQIMLTGDPGAAPFFHWPTPGGKPHFDLPAYAKARISAAGLTQIEDLARCTYAGESDFYSFRRSTHKNEPDYGRQISAIVLFD